MRLTTLTLHGQRGSQDRTPILFDSHREALRYLSEVNARRAVTGLPPAIASLRSEQWVRPYGG